MSDEQIRCKSCRKHFQPEEDLVENICVDCRVREIRKERGVDNV